MIPVGDVGDLLLSGVEPLIPSQMMPLMSHMTILPKPMEMSSLPMAMPAAPAPLMTIFICPICLPVTRMALSRAAATTMAVPCWSSWNTGMSHTSFRRRSTSKQRGGGDVLQVDAAEALGDQGDGLHQLVHVLGVHTDGEGVHPAELLEEGALALHHRHTGGRADVPQAQHRGSRR